MMKLIATKRKVENDDFRVTIGTTNKKRPVTFYIEFNCIARISKEWVVSNNLTKDLSSAIKKISSSISNEYSMEKCMISDVDFSEESLRNGKDAYLTIQFYFMQLFTCDFNALCEVCKSIIGNYSPIIKMKLSEYNIEIRKSK